MAFNRSGTIAVIDDKGREKERYAIVYGAKLRVEDGQEVKQGDLIGEWDPYTFSILTEIAGTVSFKDLQEGLTVNEEIDEVTGLSRLVVAESPDEKRQPTILMEGSVLQMRPSATYPNLSRVGLPRSSKDTDSLRGLLARIEDIQETHSSQ